MSFVIASEKGNPAAINVQGQKIVGGPNNENDADSMRLL
jgi:hypothetical protein